MGRLGIAKILTASADRVFLVSVLAVGAGAPFGAHFFFVSVAVDN